MKENQSNHVAFRIITMILLFGWMTFIFLMSNQSAVVSSKTSGGIIKWFVGVALPKLSSGAKAELISEMQFIVRKSAHFFLYAVLGFLSFLAFVSYRIHILLRTLLCLSVTLLYAALDEYHQTFIKGRSGELRDVIIDFCGSLLAVLICLAIVGIAHIINSKGTDPVKKRQYAELAETLGQELKTTNASLVEVQSDNIDLKNQISELLQENTALSEELNKLRKELSEAQVNKPEETAIFPVVTEGQFIPHNEPEKVTPPMTPKLSSNMEYGSEVIGKIVLLAAKYCNELTFPPVTDNSKELVNLILGRTEVAKSEILRIVSAPVDETSKIAAMEKERSNAEEYFRSVMAQKG